MIFKFSKDKGIAEDVPALSGKVEDPKRTAPYFVSGYEVDEVSNN